MKSVKEVLANVLAIPRADITDETGPHNVESWDSFNGLVLVTELEKNFKVSFTLEEVVGVKNVGDIKRVLKNHGIHVSE